MKPDRIRISRPSPALAIACIALFVSLGGVSYGLATGSIDSREIADNTVRSKDIRDNSVYSRDLRNNDIRSIDIRNGTILGRDVGRATLTGEHIDIGKLGQVPQAADAATLGGVAPSGYVRAAEPVRLVGGPGQPPFAVGAGAGAPPDLAPDFWIDGNGVVSLQGTVAGPAGGGVIFSLPPGYRPAGTVRIRVPATAGAATTVTIDALGTVTAADPGASLDGISFRAAAG